MSQPPALPSVLTPYDYSPFALKPGPTTPAFGGQTATMAPYVGGPYDPHDQLPGMSLLPPAPIRAPAASVPGTDPCAGASDFWGNAECRLTQLLDIGLWNVGLLALAGFGIYLALRPEINSAVKRAGKAAVLA